MKNLFASKLHYKNRWFPGLLILLMALGTIGAIILFFDTKIVFFLFSPAINLFGIWLVVKRYRFLNFFLNLWFITIALNISIQFLNLLLGLQITDTIPVLFIKFFIVIGLFICKQHSLILEGSAIPTKSGQ